MTPYIMFILFWLVLTIAFVIAELASVGLTSIWFAAGSLISMIVAIAHGPFWLQVIVFIVVSVILLIATRPLAVKYLNSKVQKTNADTTIGAKVVITENVDNYGQTGKAVLNGMEWTVRAEDDKEVIEAGKMAEVIRISGVKLIVKSVKEEEGC